jgi:hypothetical protein
MGALERSGGATMSGSREREKKKMRQLKVVGAVVPRVARWHQNDAYQKSHTYFT